MEHFAYKLASPMLQLVTKELGCVLKDKTLEIWRVDDKLRELQATYLQIESMLAKVDWWEVNPSLEPWLLDLDRYCYDTEDLVDDLILSRRRLEEKDEKPVQHPLRLRIFKSGRLTIAGQIVELQSKLQGLATLIEKVLPTQTHGVSEEHQSAPSKRNLLSDKSPLAPGTTREQDKLKIIKKLRECESSCGVSIIGMDGLGKTALARSILVDPAIKDHFPLVLTACVSGHFEMDDVIKQLVADHPMRKWTRVESYESDAIMLQELLCNKRSLIVLDDLWSVTDKDWDFFVCNYLKLSQDWRVVITTRNPKVAEVIGTCLFYLNKMTDEDCKKLIIHKAGLSALDSTRWSTDIDVIASKCKGMPLIANKFGLKLSKKQMGQLKTTIVELKMIELSKLQEFRQVFPFLNLNKPKLPPYLKRCLAYLSLFPPSHEFSKDDLIQLWEAEVFVQPQQAVSSTEALHQCFDDLLSRSILQPLESMDNNQPTYTMHEFNHDFAQRLASKAFCKVDEEVAANLLSSRDNIRHLSLPSQSTDEPLLKKIEQCKGLRTFLLLHQKEPKTCTISCCFFQKLHSLRLLDLSHTDISKLPKPIYPSKHLRYLDLSYTEIKKLPEPIRFLRALQTLKLKGCSKLLQLPKDLNQLISLTHLLVDMKMLRDKPSNIGMLTGLEVLDSFLVGKNKGYSVQELKNMKHLRKIRISGLEKINDKEEAHEIMLSEKAWLRTLVLEWDNRLAAKVTNASDVLEGLQPHNHLEDLTVRNYSGQEFPTWLASPSCQIVSIYLDNCPNCQALPSLGELELLKHLVVHSLRSVRTVDSQFHGRGKRRFPSLQSLEFRDMKALINWSELKAGDMPRLRILKTIGCPMLYKLPSFEHLGQLITLEINNCPVLQSLPKLPSSLNGEVGELIIMHTDLVTKRCKPGRGNWAAIKDIPYVEIDATRILTKLSS